MDTTLNRVGIYIYVACIIIPLVLDISPRISSYDEKRIFQILSLVVLLVICLPAYTKIFLGYVYGLERKICIAVSVLSFLGFISTIYSSIGWSSIIDFSLHMALIFGVFHIAYIRYSEGEIVDRILIKFVITVMLLSIFYTAVIFLASQSVGVTLHPEEVGGEFSNKRFFNHVQTWIIPSVLVVSLLFLRGINRNSLLFMLSIWLAVAVFTEARGTLASLLISAGIIFLIRKWAIASKIFVTLLLMSAVGFLFIELVTYSIHVSDMQPIGQLKFRPLDDSVYPRFLMWMDAIRMIIGAPLLGFGPSSYACLGVNDIAAHPHNYLLQFGAEWGGAAVILIVYLLWRLLLSVRKVSTKDITLFYALPIIAALIHGLVSGIVVSPASQSIGVLFVGALLGFMLEHEKKNDRNHCSDLNLMKINYVSVSVMVVSILCLALLFKGLTHKLLFIYSDNLLYETNGVYVNYEPAVVFPRVWSNGRHCT